MSIIGGILGTASQSHYKVLLNAMNCYQTQPIAFLQQSQAYMACGMQYFTIESLKEKLPFKTPSLSITADAIIDNREELIASLHISKDISDSQIIVAAYQKWGTHCSEHLIGDFAFAIWDNIKKILFCVRDHVGKRSLYYTQASGQFIFCTVMAPILQVIGERPLNEKWVADFLTIQGVVHEICIDETVYQGINQLPPGHQLIVTADQKIHMLQYWHPERIKTLNLGNNAAYEKAFRNVFNQAVKCRLRSSENVGIMLSSGLDSTAVAAVAAPELAKQNKKLMSFTEIPLMAYSNQMGSSKIVDESPYVLEMQKLYPNIEPCFKSFDAKNAFEGIDKRIQILEQPYKVIENLYWIEGILETAQEKQCKVLLDGQFGNFSISHGNVFCYWNTLFHQGRWLCLIKEINAFCKFHHSSRKIAYLTVLKKLFNQFKSSSLQVDPLAIVNPKLAEKYHCLARIKQKGYLFNDKRILEEHSQKQFTTNLILFSHMGAIETKQSLTYGLIRRDPTRDKRVIELCLSIPQKQFVYHGEERSLIRRAMKDAVPNSIRLNYYTRGKQAADWVQRLMPYSSEIKEELELLLSDSSIKDYLDFPKIAHLLKQYEKNNHLNIYGFELKSLMTALVFYHFIQIKQVNTIYFPA